MVSFFADLNDTHDPDAEEKIHGSDMIKMPKSLTDLTLQKRNFSKLTCNSSSKGPESHLEPRLDPL
jgi:hypothetical protein